MPQAQTSPVPGSLGEQVPRDLDEQSLADEKSIPLDVLAAAERHHEAEMGHAVVGRRSGAADTTNRRPTSAIRTCIVSNGRLQWRR